jgi:hypothetical protein
MLENNTIQLCVCGEPSCSGCSCGAACSFLPGHTDGTVATDPLRALIEAARKLLDNLASNGYCYSNREQESTYGDVRRLNATLAYAERNQKEIHTVQPLLTQSKATIEKPMEGESISVSDPGSGADVTLSVFKVSGGGIIAIDTSYLIAQPDLVVPSPFDSHVLLDLSGETGHSCCIE